MGGPRYTIRDLLDREASQGYATEPMGFHPDDWEDGDYVGELAEAPLVLRLLAQTIDVACFASLFYLLWLIPTVTGWHTDTFAKHFSTLLLGNFSGWIPFDSGLLFLTIGGLAFYLYFVLLPLRFGATTGKRMLGLRLVSTRADGKLTSGQLLRREVIGKCLLGIVATKGILLLLPGFRRDRRGFHDFIGQTVVKRAPRS